MKNMAVMLGHCLKVQCCDLTQSVTFKNERGIFKSGQISNQHVMLGE